jgi:hypothetical protein
MILREYLCHVIVRDKLSLVELREYSFSECFLYGFKVYLQEPGEDAVVPISVSEKSVQVRVIVECLTDG